MKIWLRHGEIIRKQTYISCAFIRIVIFSFSSREGFLLLCSHCSLARLMAICPTPAIVFPTLQYSTFYSAEGWWWCQRWIVLVMVMPTAWRVVQQLFKIWRFAIVWRRHRVARLRICSVICAALQHIKHNNNKMMDVITSTWWGVNCFIRRVVRHIERADLRIYGVVWCWKWRGKSASIEKFLFEAADEQIKSLIMIDSTSF